MDREIIEKRRNFPKHLSVFLQFGNLKSVQNPVHVESLQDFRKGNAKTNKKKDFLTANTKHAIYFKTR